MPRDPLIGLVGKPSSGKSTTLNSLTDATSKVGNYPFTTLTPNRAIGYLHLDCACARFDLQGQCRPNYGSCHEGQRSVPIELLDVAGLVPGAHEGKGLGNRFLDDLRHADGLIHVVDVSGTTDAEGEFLELDISHGGGVRVDISQKEADHFVLGKATRGYDPSQDIVWLRSEIVSWIKGNLMEKWGGIKRRHVAVKNTPVQTLQNQFSGYGSTSKTVARCLDKLAIKEPLEDWSDATIDRVVNAFTDEKFPTVIALNKIDHADADKNIAKISKMQPPSTLVLTSAISETFLRRLASQNYIRYIPGSDSISTREDLIEDGDPTGGNLKEMDEKLRTRVENCKDMVLYRFGSTGVVEVLRRAGEMLGLVGIFPVKNIHSFGAGGGGGTNGEQKVFRDCVLVKKGTTVGEVGRKIMGDVPIAFVETVGGIRVSDEDTVEVGRNDILSFKVGRA